MQRNNYNTSTTVPSKGQKWYDAKTSVLSQGQRSTGVDSHQLTPEEVIEAEKCVDSGAMKASRFLHFTIYVTLKPSHGMGVTIHRDWFRGF